MKFNYIVFPLMSLLIGCSGSSNDSSDVDVITTDDTSGEVTPPNNEVVELFNGGVFDPLIGTWAQCSDGADGESVMTLRTYREDGTWNTSFQGYDVAGCQGDARPGFITEIPSYIVRNTRTTSEGLTAAVVEWASTSSNSINTEFLVVNGDTMNFAFDIDGNLTTFFDQSWIRQ